MEQEALVREVLETLPNLPTSPPEGRYLTLEEAEAIVDDTLQWLASEGDPVEFRYLTGHRRRLAITLTMIPKAAHPNASLIDVGCYGYMAYWAHRHLGYGRVEGIELRPERQEAVIVRDIRLRDDYMTLSVRNLDISKPGWSLTGYDTVLLFETLEHVNEDPSGVLERISAGLPEGGTLVMSVPNSISYKTLNEILMGAPPWTYWFYKPDLAHEPRHSLEYTPVFFLGLLRAAGFRTTAFRTVIAYADRQNLDGIFALGKALSIDEALFGETMIAHAVKDSAGGVIRFPDMIYNGDAYYYSTWPLLAPKGQEALSNVLQKLADADALPAAREALLASQQAEVASAALAAQRAEEASAALAAVKQSLEASQSAEAASAALAARRADELSAAERRIQETSTRLSDALTLLLSATSNAETLSEKVKDEDRKRHEADKLRGEVDRHRRRAVDRTNAMERELRGVKARLVNTEKELNGIKYSTSWRATAPLRSVIGGFPTLRKGFRKVVGPIVRVLRRPK